MANIKITVEGPLMDGHKITFKAPCNCDVVEKLDVRYIESNTQKSKLFTMKDSHGNDLTGLGNLFYQDAYVDVVLDPNSLSAYLQNAGTNGYLEERLKTAGTPVDNLESDRADLPLSARQGKILNESLGGVRFGVNGDGRYGYYGADDSFIPFSQLKLLHSHRQYGASPITTSYTSTKKGKIAITVFAVSSSNSRNVTIDISINGVMKDTLTQDTYTLFNNIYSVEKNDVVSFNIKNSDSIKVGIGIWG